VGWRTEWAQRARGGLESGLTQEGGGEARRVGFEAGEEAEGFDGLMDGHEGAIEGGAAEGAGGAEEFGFEREVDDFRDPEGGAQERGGEGEAGMGGHAGGGGVDEAVGGGEGLGEVAGDCNAGGGEEGLVAGDEGSGAGGVSVVDGEVGGAEVEEGVSGCCSGTAGTELDDVIEGGVGEAVEEGLAEAEPVSVVAGAAARAEEDGVDGADGRGVGGDFSEQGKDGLLAGVGDVETGEVGELGELEERGEVFGEKAELVEVDELVVAQEAVGGGFCDVHGWGAGGEDAGADEAEEEAGG